MRRPLLSMFVSVPFVMAGLLLACGPSNPTDGGTEEDFHVHAEMEPDPPMVGDNTMTISVHDHDHEPLPGLSLTVTPWMPAHGHGTDVTAMVSDEGEGQYIATMVNFSMPGEWQVKVGFSHDGKDHEEVFTYDVGSSDGGMMHHGDGGMHDMHDGGM